MTPFHLTLEAAKAGALKAHAKNRLTAQHLSASFGCVYSAAGGLGCAIGVNLPAPVLKQVQSTGCNGGTVYILEDRKLITTDNIEGLRSLQRAHDSWCSGIITGASDVAKREERFLALCAA